MEPARRALEKAEASSCRLLLPRDLVAGATASRPTPSGAPLDGVDVPDGWMGLDVGPRTARRYAATIERRGHGVLERPDGRVRARAVRGGHQARVAEAMAATARHHGRRRRRLRPRRSRSSASPTASTTSRPAAARRSSCSRARRCPGVEVLTMPEPHSPFIAGNWKMHETRSPRPRSCIAGAAAAVGVVERRRRRRSAPPFTRAARRCVDSRARLARCRSTRRTCTRSRPGAYTGEVSAPMLTEIGVRRAWCSATPSAASTSARPTGRSSRRCPRRSRPGCGRSSASARPRRSASAATPSASCATRSRRALEKVADERLPEVVDRLRADLGDRHRPGRHARAGAGRDRVRARARAATATRTPASACAILYGGSREARQRGRAARAARRRRRAGRRREPRRRRVRARSSRRPRVSWP